MQDESDRRGPPPVRVGVQGPGRSIHCTEDARRLARRRLPRLVFDFVEGAAGTETAARLNRAALKTIRLQPKVLENVEGRNLSTRLLGHDMSMPFGFAPMGMCALSWPGADRFLAAEAVSSGLPLCVSSAASTSLEEMQRQARGRAWFQLYVGRSQEAAFELVDRAAAAGYEVLVLTVDVPQVARRVRELRRGFSVPFKLGPQQMLDFACHPRWSLGTLMAGLPRPRNFETDGFDRAASRGGTDWAFLQRLRSHWRGSLVVKGVLCASDALRIKEAGADAIYVSNHGGRQLDSAPAAICALPPIRQAVGPDYPLIFDSGLRSGEDIVKALALGADFVMLGRPMLYAIGADGARGLARLTEILAEEISIALAQIGRRQVADLDGSVLAEGVGLTPATADSAYFALEG